MTYEAYLEKMRAIGPNYSELVFLLDKAVEDPCISCGEFEALWFVWRNIMGGGDF